MDDQVGQLRDKLRELGIEENTVVFYTSDNGPEGKSVTGKTQGQTKGLKGRKRSLYEGGIRVPEIMEWPKNIKPGTTVTVPCLSSDYFPTIDNILEFDLKENERPYYDANILSFSLNNKRERETPMAFSIEQQAALIDGRNKIYRDLPTSPFELYNIIKDPGEKDNLAERNLKKLSKIEAFWNARNESRQASAEGKDY